MRENESNLARYEQAYKKVREIKRFYNHLGFFLLCSLLALLVAPFVVGMLRAQGIENYEILRWIKLNILLLPVYWLPALVIHAMVAYWYRLSPWFRRLKPGFLKQWEKRQIRRYLEEEQELNSNS